MVHASYYDLGALSINNDNVSFEEDSLLANIKQKIIYPELNFQLAKVCLVKIKNK